MPRTLAPIALFAYRRLDHLKRTIEALKKNSLATESELFIYSDGSKGNQDVEDVNSIRTFVRTVSGFRKIEIIEAKTNKGLASSIIDGVSELTQCYGKVIVVEDDIVTTPYFLKYMNDALEFYEHEPKVFHISGYNFPMMQDNEDETYFMVPATCWGWATWSRAWKYFHKDVNAIIPKFTPSMIKDFNLNNSNPYFYQLIQNQKKEINTWAIFWHAAVFLNHGLSLHPVKSFCLNIGHDATGEHCSKSNAFDLDLDQDHQVRTFSKNIQESAHYRKKVERFFIQARPNIMRRIVNKLLSYC